MRFILFIASQILLSQSIFAHNVPDDYFRSPVEIPVLLSGTFGEPRSTHFHAGIDIRTDGVEGKRILAVADGYVSRIKISPHGYGNALYITHPNGYVSVYAHLQKFNPQIAKFSRQKQLENTSFEIDIEKIDPNLLPVSKGDLIALSGNTGGSAGPHLHFEIRDTTDKVYNPLLFGFDKFFKDNIAPSVTNLVVYNQGEDRQFTDSKVLPLVSLGNNKFKIATPLKVNRNVIGLGVQAIDQHNSTNNKNGIYEAKLFVEEKLVYHYQMNSFTFDVGKSVFSHCDYQRRLSGNQIIHKCFKEKGNPIKAYPFLLNNGLLELFDNTSLQVYVEISDYHGNKSTIILELIYDENSQFFKEQKASYTEFFSFDKRNIIRRDKIEANIAANTFFDDIYFHYHSEDKPSGHSDWFYLHNALTPVWNYFDVKIKLNKIESQLIDKYIVVHKNSKGGISAVGGVFENGYITSRSRNLGLHYVTIDSVAPVITPTNISPNKLMTTQKSIQLKASDNLSGIKEYNAFLNGEWVLLEYDAKNKNFEYHFDEFILKGENHFEVIISDACNNASSYAVKFKY